MSSLAAIKAELIGVNVRHEIRRASDPVGSGAARFGRWDVAPIVGLTARTIIVRFSSGRTQSIAIETWVGRRNGDIVTGLHPDDRKAIGEAYARLRAELPGGSS